MDQYLQELDKRIGKIEKQLSRQPETPKTNYIATVAPGVGDDIADGYSVGSVWINVSADDAYICLDSTAGAAVWKKTTP